MLMKELLLAIDIILLILHAPMILMDFSFKRSFWRELNREERMILTMKVFYVVSVALFATLLGVAIMLKSDFLEPTNDWITWGIAYCAIILFFPAGAWGEDFERFFNDYKESGENVWEGGIHALRDTVKTSVKNTGFIFAVHFGKALIAIALWHLGIIENLKAGLLFAFAIPPWILIYTPLLGIMFAFVCLFAFVGIIIVHFF